MVSYRIVAAVLFASTVVNTAHAAEGYKFVEEYVRELATLEGIRDTAEKELAQSASDPSARMAACVRNGQRYQLELNADILLLKEVKLAKPLDDVPSQIVQFYEIKLDNYRRMTDICSTMLSRPKAGIDYGKLSAELHKITANIEYMD